jgi:hypothetical protein
MEEWKSINKEYEISNFGNLKRTKNGTTKLIKPEKLKKGYLRVSMYENGKRNRYLVHRLVAEYLIPNPLNKKQVDHINNNTSDNRVENLRWVTPKENVQHSIEQGRFVTDKKIKALKGIKLTEERMNELRKQGFQKGSIPWNKGKKGLQIHTEEWKQQASLRMKKTNKIKQTPVICVETGEIFESQTTASKIKKISQGNIGSCLKGKRNVAGGYHWKYYKEEESVCN